MLCALKESGVRTLELGVESYSDIVLQSMKKGITKQQIDYAYELCDKVGVNVTSNIIIGDPVETEETIKESLGFVSAHSTHVINVGFLLAIPDSDVWRYALSHGLIQDKLGFIKAGFPVINLTKMSDRKFNIIRKHILIQDMKKKRVKWFSLKILGVLLLRENGLLYEKLRRMV